MRAPRLAWVLISVVWLWLPLKAFGAEAASVRSGEDQRVRHVSFVQDQVQSIKVRRGTVTRVLLGAEEKIEVPVTGMSSRCENDADQWCVYAAVGTNQIFVRPKEGASRTNMEVRTNRHDYSLEFIVVSDVRGSASRPAQRDGADEPAFRVVFDYPAPAAVVRAAVADAILGEPAPAPKAPVWPTVDDRLHAKLPQALNTSYTMQVLEKGEDAAPSMVFDDGRFTYFEFRGAREVPAVFAYGSDDVPTRVNWHMEGAFIVVERTARKFTLRLGDAVTGVFNEAFDPVGLPVVDGTVVSGVRRTTKE